MAAKRSLLTFFPALLALALLMGACAEASSAFNKYYRGKTLDIAVVTLERTPELRYRVNYSSGDSGETTARHFRIAPSSPDQELVLLRLKVENHTATSAIVNIDQQAAELRDFTRGSYRPIDVKERAEEVSAPENPADERSMVFLWNKTQEDGTSKAFVLQRDYGIDGWMVFEAPKETKFRELRWRAGDSLTIEF